MQLSRKTFCAPASEAHTDNELNLLIGFVLTAQYQEVYICRIALNSYCIAIFHENWRSSRSYPDAMVPDAQK